MTPETVMSLGQQALGTMVLLAAPLLIAALSVGLLIGMLQAATQINEMTLSFIPKLMVMVVVLWVGGAWMLEIIMTYTRTLFADIPALLN